MHSHRFSPSSLFAELRRRHVVRVALAYGVVGWLLFEVASEAFPALGLPDWSVTLVLALLLLGLPLALALAWAFDVTPQGIRRTSPEPPAAPGSSGGAEGAAAVAAARPASARPGIAVLPFVNMSGDPDNEYFSDGVTEDLLTHLSRIRGLRVVSRTTAMRYKGSTKSLAEIARELDVATVLEGSVRRSGQRVRITAQLIDAGTDEHLWAESFDRDIEDIFRVQSEVARSIAGALRTELSPNDEARLGAKPTESMEAYNLVLRAQSHGNHFVQSEFETAIRLYRKATELDPGYARAWAGMAEMHSLMALMQFRSRAEGYELGLAAARKAVELDGDLAEAHGSLGGLKLLCEWDWPGVERSLGRALELDPDQPVVLGWHALYLMSRERTQAALEAARRARSCAPHDLGAANVLAQVLIFSERMDEAIELMEETLALDPGYELGRYWLAYALGASGRVEEGLAQFGELFDRGGAVPLWEGVRGALLALAGRGDEARETLRDLEERKAQGEEVGGYALFSVHLALGDVERAMDRLEAALTAREAPLLYLRMAPRFRPLRAHPRFRRVLAAIWPEDFDGAPGAGEVTPAAPERGRGHELQA